jgi:hypothetical protein
MKTLIDYAKENELVVVEIKYHGWGTTNIGYDIINPKNAQIIVAIEPYFIGDTKWYFRDVHKNYDGERYFKKISKKMLSQLNPKADSFMINSTFKYSKQLK